MISKITKTCLVIFICLINVHCHAQESSSSFLYAKVIRVVDGDTIDADIELGFSVFMRDRIRLMGIDTPESRTSDKVEKKLINLMTKFGAEFTPKNKFFFPLYISSSNYPIGTSYKSDTSAQLKSAVILAALNSNGAVSYTHLTLPTILLV